MTKKELIEKLNDYPYDVEIGYVDSYSWVEIEDVILHEETEENSSFIEVL